MKSYYFFIRRDINKEPINKIYAISRRHAAEKFAERKNLSLKSFLLVYEVSR